MTSGLFDFEMRVTNKDRSGYYYPNWDNAFLSQGLGRPVQTAATDRCRERPAHALGGLVTGTESTQRRTEDEIRRDLADAQVGSGDETALRLKGSAQVRLLRDVEPLLAEAVSLRAEVERLTEENDRLVMRTDQLSDAIITTFELAGRSGADAAIESLADWWNGHDIVDGGDFTSAYGAYVAFRAAEATADAERDRMVQQLRAVTEAAVVAFKGPEETDAERLDHAATRIENGHYIGGQHTRAAVANVLRAVATALAGDVPPPAETRKRPEIVCLCGSTRFKAEFEQASRQLGLAGKIVLSVSMFGHSGDLTPEQCTDGHPTKTALDELHKRKIDLADQVLVINPGGYIGTSTRSEIAYAEAHGKPVSYSVSPVAASSPTPTEGFTAATEKGYTHDESRMPPHRLDPDPRTAEPSPTHERTVLHGPWRALYPARDDSRTPASPTTENTDEGAGDA